MSIRRKFQIAAGSQAGVVILQKYVKTKNVMLLKHFCFCSNPVVLLI